MATWPPPRRPWRGGPASPSWTDSVSVCLSSFSRLLCMLLLCVGNTPLHIAVMLGHKGKNKVDHHIFCTPLNHNTQSQHIRLCHHLLLSTELVECLLNHGALVKEKNKCGWTPLDEAISYGDKSTSQYCTISFSPYRPICVTVTLTVATT